MIDDLKPYSDYRESGQAWVGTIPSHWDVLPNRAIFEEVKERNHPGEEMLSVTITRGVIKQKALLAESSKKDSSNKDKSAYKLVCPRDIAYNKMRAWQGSIGVSEYRGIISPAYVVMRLRGYDDVPCYFHHLYRTPHFAKEAERWSYGITSDMWSLRPEHFKMIYTPVPPPNEQTAIVCFLNHVYQRIERTIRAKRKVIALLNEQKQVIIHHAVSRGINPNVRLKPSGILGVGNIPEHWEELRLGRVINLLTGFPFASAGFSQNESDTRLLRGINVTPLGIRWDQVVYWKRNLGDKLYEYELAVNDIVLGMDRPIINSGVRASIIEGNDVPALLLQRVARIRPTRKIMAGYLIHLLRGRMFSDYMAPIFTGISVPHLSPDQIKNFIIALPPVTEQDAIIRYIDEKTAALSMTIVRTEREIELLREFRTRLSADVVTGKLDVRETASKLPDETVDLLTLGSMEEDADVDEIESGGEEAA